MRVTSEEGGGGGCVPLSSLVYHWGGKGGGDIHIDFFFIIEIKCQQSPFRLPWWLGGMGGAINSIK